MARTAPRPGPTITRDLHPRRVNCPHCGKRMRADYTNRRTVATPAGLTRLHLLIRRCHTARCSAHRRPYRPEAEGRFALPRHEFGLDVVALVGRLRHAEHRAVPETRPRLVARGWRWPSGPSPTCWTATTSCSPSPSPTTAGWGSSCPAMFG